MHRVGIAIFLCLLLAACGSPYKKLARNYQFYGKDNVPDYALLENWAAHPDKTDPSDSVPKPLRADYRRDSSFDVFFIHPTTYTQPEKQFGQNASVSDAFLAAKTDYSTILFQASIFNEAARLFAPRYRQAHFSSYLPLTAADTARSVAAFDLAYEDVKRAFLYYLQYYNHGRPFIVAAHSQGTTHGKRLMKELIDGKPLQQQLVAAYLIGMPVEPDYFTAIKPCATPSQTGCFCSWRTYGTGYQPEYVQAEKFTAVVINPLTWKMNEPAVDRMHNPGSILRNFNKVLPHNVGAAVHNGVLWTDKPRFFGSAVFLRTKNYHIADMNLFYISMRNNVRERVNAFRGR